MVKIMMIVIAVIRTNTRLKIMMITTIKMLLLRCNNNKKKAQ